VQEKSNITASNLGSGKKVSDLSFHPLCGGTLHHLLRNHHPFPIDEFNAALEQVSGLLERINGGNPTQSQLTPPQASMLNENFLSSVKIAARPGLNLG